MVRRGVAYRSNQLNPISPADLKKTADLGLKTDFDLRTAEEREAKPDVLPARVTDVCSLMPKGTARQKSRKC